MKIKNKLNQRRLKSFVIRDKGWCSSEEFVHLLRREQHRSERTGSPISHIIFDLSKYSNHSDEISENEYFDFLKELIVLITQNTREYDVKYFPCPTKIGLLLIDASINDAKLFIDRISKKLHEHFQSVKKGKFIHVVQAVRISSYPLDQTCNCRIIEANPTVVNNPELKREKKNETGEVSYKESSNFHMSWRIQPSSKGSLALSAPTFSDLIHGQKHYLTYQLFKRIIDTVGSLFLIIASSPLMLLISIAIKVTSKGPILFKQERIGYLGRSFTFLKFRTMHMDSDDDIHREYVTKLINGNADEINVGTDENPFYKMTEDPRVTNIGKFLRRSSLDELPQLFNVLKGEMSLIGPRPPIPYEVREYKNWHYRRLVRVRPGITGLWQVSGRSRTTFDEMVRLDIQYAENVSFLLDLKILFKTVKTVLACDGT